MTALTRRHVLLASAALAAPAILPRAVRASDAQIEVSSPWGADSPFQKVVDAYNAKATGVSVENRFDGDYQAMATKALAGIAAGRAPTLMITGWKFGYFAKRTLGARDLREIDAARADRIISNFVPSVHPLVTIDGSLIGLPWAMSTPISFVNMELWKAAGLDETLPQEFDADWLYAQAAQLDAALKGKHDGYRSALDLSNNEWTSQSFIQNAGGYIIDPAGELALTSPEAIRGMELFVEPAKKGLWIPVSGKEQEAAFQSGALAITTTSSTRAVRYPGSVELATAKFPGVPGHARRMNSGGNFLAVYARDEEKAQAAMDFLEFCASAEGQGIWAGVGYLNTSVHDVPLINDYMAPAAAQLDDGLTAETIWPGARGLEGQDIWRKWVSRMLTGDVEVAQGMEQAAAELAPVLNA